MKLIKSIKLLGVATVVALSFSGSAHALEVISESGEAGFGRYCPPVPEADTWAMMAVGLGLVGLRLRRKSKDDKNVSGE